MRSRPDAAELLEIAEITLAGEVAPDLSSRQRYNVALITSALGIARRELSGGISAWPGEIETLQSLYGTKHMETDDVVIHRLNRKFALDLRAGVYDEKGRDQRVGLRLLREDVLARLAEDNPRYEK